MSKKIQAPRGTTDYLPDKAKQLDSIIEQAFKLFERYGYQHIITPSFEDTALFSRSIGESSDIVRKEMYSFLDKAGRNLTLRPEATAPVVRAYIEHHLNSKPQPLKLYYFGSMYRYERPQAGRYREFMQLGVEVLGSSEPVADAEVIILLLELLEKLGLEDLKLQIGSMGCSDCRQGYRRRLANFLKLNENELCSDCQERASLNPLRVFDCKNPACCQILTNAPKIINYLCDNCQQHFQAIQELLIKVGISYQVDSSLVRGFDYYTRTTFEVQSSKLGAQNALGGGGRYDNLVEQYGGPPTPAIGFALGLERILLSLEKQKKLKTFSSSSMAFIAVVDNSLKSEAIKLATQLRQLGISAQLDLLSRSLRAQMKYANKLGVKFTIILGPDEIKEQQVVVRDMKESQELKVGLNDLGNYLRKRDKDATSS